jgi:hypothetical protein
VTLKKLYYKEPSLGLNVCVCVCVCVRARFSLLVDVIYCYYINAVLLSSVGEIFDVGCAVWLAHRCSGRLNLTSTE